MIIGNEPELKIVTKNIVFKIIGNIFQPSLKLHHTAPIKNCTIWPIKQIRSKNKCFVEHQMIISIENKTFL